MPLLNLLDTNGYPITAGCLPAPPNLAAIIISPSHVGGSLVSYDTLMKLLEGLPVKLKKIKVYSFNHASPEFLAFLLATFERTERLSLNDISLSEEVNQIVSGLSRASGLKELHLNISGDPMSRRETQLSNDSLQMLFRGLSFSTSLEKLHLEMRNSLDEELGNELASAIRGIQRLRSLELNIRLDTESPWWLDVLRAAVLDAQVKDLHIFMDAHEGGMNPALNEDDWVETFRSPRCALENFRLNVRWTEDAHRLSVQRIFSSAILDANIKTFILCNSKKRRPLTIDHHDWVHALCRPTCMMEKLHLHGVKLDLENLEGASNGPALNTAKNTSVKDLCITCAALKCAETREMVNRFQSLESLKLKGNRILTRSHNLLGNTIRTLSVFNNLVSGDESTLIRLVLDAVNVKEDDLKSFLNRVPHMKNLRALELRIENSKRGSNPCTHLLEKAVFCNTSLQQVKYDHNRSETRTTKWKDHFDKNMGVSFSLNRAGRGFLQQTPSIPSGLWSLILDRAGKIQYYSVYDDWDCPSRTDTRVDAVYWLLREKLFL